METSITDASPVAAVEVPSTEQVTIETQHVIIARMRDELAEAREALAVANRSISEINQSRNILSNDFQVTLQRISERLINEANDRDWCSIYDNIVEDVNSTLPGPYYLDAREQEFNIEVRLTAQSVAYTTVQVRARNRDEAEDLLRDDPDGYIDVNDVLVECGELQDENIEII